MRRLSELRHDQIKTLDRLADEGFSLTAAAAHLGMDPRTLKASAKRANKEQWLAERFPAKPFTGTRYKPDGRVRKTLSRSQQTAAWTAATMSWGAAKRNG